MKKPNTLNIGFDFYLPDFSIDLSKLSKDAVQDKIQQPLSKPKQTKPRKPKKQDQLELF